MSAIGAIILGAAAKVGAPIVKGLIEKHAGPLAGSVAGTVIDVIAGHAGVPVDQLPSIPADKLEAAVAATEHDFAALQRETNAVFKMEHDEETVFAWGWRPGMMWLLGFLVVWSVVLVPSINALTGAGLPIFLSEILTIMGVYSALYMGGHTIKEWKKS
jgi:hypothetical protein